MFVSSVEQDALRLRRPKDQGELPLKVHFPGKLVGFQINVLLGQLANTFNFIN